MQNKCYTCKYGKVDGHKVECEQFPFPIILAESDCGNYEEEEENEI